MKKHVHRTSLLEGHEEEYCQKSWSSEASESNTDVFRKFSCPSSPSVQREEGNDQPIPPLQDFSSRKHSQLTHPIWEHSQPQLGLWVWRGRINRKAFANIKYRIKAKLQLWLKFTLDNTNTKKVLLPVICKQMPTSGGLSTGQVYI